MPSRTTGRFRAAIMTSGAVALALLACAPGALRAQSNFSFWMGGTATYFSSSAINWGTSVGANGKFNVTDIFLVRGQFNVDRVQLHDITLPDFQGTQTVSFVCLGAGPEIGLGNRDFDFLAHITPHGTIRTTSRIVTENGKERVWSLTQFSMGLVAGFGFEAFITDNLGVELQTQYDTYNFEGTEVDPFYKSIRALVGVQFYLGRNFLR
jgi:hypothetical protein